MNLFNKNNSNTGRPAGIGDTARVKNALTALKRKYTETTEEEMTNALYECITTGTWVNMSAYGDKEHGYGTELRPMGSDMYAVWYTDPSEIKAPRYSLMMTDINKIVDMIYAHPDLTGMVINPDTDGFAIDKDTLLTILLHSPYRDLGLPDEPREWGPGIPAYSPRDLMTEVEITNFAIELLTEPLEKEGYEIISTCDNPAVAANIIAQKNDDLCLIAVHGYCAEEEPGLSMEAKKNLLECKAKYHTRCYYAPIAIRSSDKQRFAKCLALRGDAFVSRYTGLQEI